MTQPRVRFLDERIGVGEQFVSAMVLVRPSYTAAYLVVRGVDGKQRMTYRNTGSNYWFETYRATEDWLLDGEVELITRRFGLRGPQLSKFVRYYTDAAEGIAALQALREPR